MTSAIDSFVAFVDVLADALTGEMVTRAARLVGQMGMWNAAMVRREYDWSVEKDEPIDSMQRRLAVEVVGRRDGRVTDAA